MKKTCLFITLPLTALITGVGLGYRLSQFGLARLASVLVASFSVLVVGLVFARFWRRDVLRSAAWPGPAMLAFALVLGALALFICGWAWGGR
jgi:hypothetical protein